MVTLHLTGDEAADGLLAGDPLALLLAMLLDSRVPMEKAFVGPYVLAQRLGVDRLNVADLADHDPEDLAAVFSAKPAVHRFPKAMAERSQQLARTVRDRFDGDPASVWTGAADGEDLVKRIASLPGFGDYKARIFTALLGKQLGIQPRGWRAAAGDFGKAGSFRSVADIVDAESLGKVREAKKAMKAAAKADQG